MLTLFSTIFTIGVTIYLLLFNEDEYSEVSYYLSTSAYGFVISTCSTTLLWIFCKAVFLSMQRFEYNNLKVRAWTENRFVFFV